MRQKSKLYGLIIGIVALALMTVSCERKEIRDVKLDPSRYSQRPVVVSGEVIRSVSALGRGAYEIDDGTGQLWIISAKGVPREGAKVVARGRIRDAYDLGAFVKLRGISSVVVMMEESHQTR